LYSVETRIHVLAEVLDPGSLDARVVSRRLDEVQEVGDLPIEPLLQ